MDERQTSEAAERNKGPILAVLRDALPPHGEVLEVASGTGQHVAHFAAALPGLRWRPSDPDRAMHGSIRAWTEGLFNVRPPLALDVARAGWEKGGSADVVLAINMIHIAPWEAALGLLRGAGALLRAGGLLYLYGPFSEAGLHVAVSNAAFDQSLRARNPLWGVRDLEQVTEAAREQGFQVDKVAPMPANNRSVLLRKT
jgi:SAM-dependent methyltransferase